MSKRSGDYIQENEEKTLLQSHFDKIRRRLEAEGEAAKSFQHGLNRGQIREVFIREFLAQNMSRLVGVGTGEIVHAGTRSDEERNQIDVVIHNNRYPKISLAAGIDLFFIETVFSFIEIKSNLKKEHLREIASNTRRIKSTSNLPGQRFNPTGMIKQPRPYSFVFAYDGPRNIKTVFNWMREISQNGEYKLGDLRKTAPENRAYFDHLFIDGVFVLGTGFAYVDALPFQSMLCGRANIPLDTIWGYSREDELPFLWALVNRLGESYLWNNFDFEEYVGSVKIYMDQ